MKTYKETRAAVKGIEVRRRYGRERTEKKRDYGGTQ